MLNISTSIGLSHLSAPSKAMMGLERAPIARRFGARAEKTAT